MQKHTILFLAANPSGTEPRALDREARAIQEELEHSGHRDRFEFETRWSAQPLDLLRELRRLRPTVVHFSGDSGPEGLSFQGPDGRARAVSAEALKETFGALDTPVKIVVLDASYSVALAEALLAHVDCVVGMEGSIRDDAARSFAIGFYGGLGERASIAAAYRQGQAAISLEGLRDGARPRLKVREEVDPAQIILGAGPSVTPPLAPAPTGLIDFTAERQRHARFVGRKDVLATLEQWLDGPEDTRWVIVTGSPGTGKSAILSALLGQRAAASVAMPHHFVRRQVADWDQPEVIAASLASQIEAAFPALRDPEVKPERRLLELLGRVSMRIGSSGRLTVIVDGLDEVRAEPGDNPLPRFLPHVVPAGIRFLCATRRTYPHLSWIEARNPARYLDLDDARWAASNEAVVRGFWEAVASEYQPPLTAEMVATAIARADGNILHAVMLHDALRELPADKRRADRIPRGLKALIGEVWDRAASHEGVRTGLGLLCAAQEALSLDVLAELAGWRYEEKERFVREARQILFEEPAAWAGTDAYRLRHDWVRELIAERLGAPTIRGHHETLSRRLATWPPPAEPVRQRYAVRHALAHRIAIDDWKGVRELASDLGYLELQARAADPFAVEQDLADAGARCPDPAVARDLADLARATACESHLVRADPRGTAGLIWNRLRRSGWTTEELDDRITAPRDAVFLRVRHVASRESSWLERTFDSHTAEVNACALLPDGRRVLSASDDRSLKVWDLDTGRVLATLEGHTAGVSACAVTPDGRRAISASRDGRLKIWDLHAGRVLATMEGHARRVTACLVLPDRPHAVSASDDGTLKVWDLDGGRLLATLEGHADRVRGCAVIPGRRRVVSASDDGRLKIWDLDTGHTIATVAVHEDGVAACAVTPDGRRMVSATDDGVFQEWDLETCQRLRTFRGGPPWVRACAVTPDGRCLISTSMRTLKVWELESGRDLATFDGHAGWVTACTVTPDGRVVISASADHTLKVWHLNAGRAVDRQAGAPVSSTLEGHAAGVNACAMAPDGRRMVSASDDHTLKIWDVEAGRVLTTLCDHAFGVRACAFMPDGRRVVSAAADRTLKVWDLDLGRAIDTLQLGAASVTSCAVAPDGRCIVADLAGPTLRVRDLDTGRVLATLLGHTDGVTACAVTPDGRRVVSASVDRTLRVWDLDTGRVLATFEGHTDRVAACAVTSDGGRMVSASFDHTLKVWELDTGRILTTLEGHTDWVTSCVVTPDGRHVVSVSADRTLRIWDLVGGEYQLVHRGDPAFQCVVITADAIIAGDRGGTVWFFERPWPI